MMMMMMMMTWLLGAERGDGPRRLAAQRQ